MKDKDELLTIPGIGKAIAADLHSLGIDKVVDLKGKDPQGLYEEFNRKVGYRVDPCVLYTFRCAVYFASNKHHDLDLLKWWNWKAR